MSGILDVKSRIMDVVLTQEGRRQLAAGKFVPEFISFTDGNTFYQQDAVSGSTDPSGRIFFEASSRHQDQIVLEQDDSGRLVPYDGGGTKVSTNGRIYSASYKEVQSPAGSFNEVKYEATNGVFSEIFNTVSTAILDSLTQQELIGTAYPYEPYNDFALSTGSIEFSYNNVKPFRGPQPVTTVSAADPLFVDKRLSHLPSFRFLPPVFKDESGNIENFGTYASLKTTDTDEFTYSELLQELIGSDPSTPTKEKITVDFSLTSIQSNVFMQMFEGGNNTPSGIPKLTKLDCVDFGEFKDENDKDKPFKRVFFVGKVYIDEYESPTFINLFTIVAE